MEFLWGCFLKSHLVAHIRWPLAIFISVRLLNHHQKISDSSDIINLGVQIDNLPFIYDARLENKYLSIFAISLLR